MKPLRSPNKKTMGLCGSTQSESSEPTRGTASSSGRLTAVLPIPIARGNSVRSAALHCLFSKHDGNSTNALSPTDVASLYIDMTMTKNSTIGSNTPPPTQQDINAIMRFIDSDGSQALDRGEFLEWLEGGMQKKGTDLEKFGAQGRTESLLVDFLQGVIAHTHAWMGSFHAMFKGDEDDGITDAKLWSTLQKGMTNARMFASGGGSGSVSTGEVPPLKSILLMTSAGATAGLIQPQHAVDFLVHMALHSGYRPLSVTPQYKQIYRTMLSTIESGMFDKKTSAKTVISNPLVVLACSAMFSTYDTSGDDVLDGAELRRMLVSICEDTNGPPGRDETQELLKLLDVDGDGMCSREEFINAVLSIMSSETTAPLAAKLEIGVVDLARQLERRRTMLHRLHKKYSYNQQINRDGLSRLLRHCQRKQRIIQQEGGGDSKTGNRSFAKVTEVSVDAVLNCYEAASNVAGNQTGTTDDDAEFILSSPGFSGPILLSSCLHPTQIKEQRLQNREMSIVLDMYELINAEVGRMVIEGDVKRERKRNAVRTQKPTQAKQSAMNSDTSSDEDDNDNRSFSGGGQRSHRSNSNNNNNGAVDFGW